MFSDRYNQALEYASWLHRNQTRKGTGTPYISHLVAVSLLVMDHGGTEDEAIAALLHDALEDGPDYNQDLPQYQGLTEDEIREKIQTEICDRFGKTVLEIVLGCTQSKDSGRDWYERKQAYIDHVPQASESIQLVSCCDKLHNALSILRDYQTHGESLWSRFNRGQDGVMFYYPQLAAIFSQVSSSRVVPVAAQLNTTVQALQALSGS